MGRLPGVPPETGQWLHGNAEMPGVHREAAEGAGLPGNLHCGTGFRSRRQRNRLVHDFSAQEGQAIGVL